MSYITREYLKENYGGTVALVPGAFKPPHKGHLAMIQQYADMADRVIIFMSPLPRKTPAGYAITFAMAKSLLDLYLKVGGLSNKVKVLESPVNSPVGAVYQFIANKEDKPEWAQEGDTVILGAGEKEKNRFNLDDAKKYAREGVTVRAGPDVVAKAEGNQVSATQMRAAIDEGDVEKFKLFLPDKLQNKAEQILLALKPDAIKKNPLVESLRKLVHEEIDSRRNNKWLFVMGEAQYQGPEYKDIKVGNVLAIEPNPVFIKTGSFTALVTSKGGDKAKIQDVNVSTRCFYLTTADLCPGTTYGTYRSGIGPWRKIRILAESKLPKIIELDYGLRLSREDLPQIKSDEITKPETGFKAYLDKRGIKYKEVKKRVNQLTPIQKEINLDKVEGMVEKVGIEGLRHDKPILTSKDNYLVDGHHRWYALLKDNPETIIDTLEIDLTIGELIEVMKDYPGVFYKTTIQETKSNAR